ncbi:MAG: hypothetical protein BAJALOKI2v1_940008 [Promethearchaeota archaeon]|nr:MAG: hypothetical protein BAJALOKI2v1_940008 [Candidatus Lokiarchaeota archaeon]
MITNIFVIREGIALIKFNFGDCHSFIDDDYLIAGFKSGL